MLVLKKIKSCEKLCVAIKYLFRDKTFVATNRILSRQLFCFSRLAYFYREKHVCRVKSMFVETKTFVAINIILLRQAYFCRNKKTCFVVTNMFVATKMIHVAAPAHDNGGVGEYDVGLFHVTGNAYCFSQGMYDRLILCHRNGVLKAGWSTGLVPSYKKRVLYFFRAVYG